MFDESVEGLAVVGDVLGCSMYGWSEVVGVFRRCSWVVGVA